MIYITHKKRSVTGLMYVSVATCFVVVSGMNTFGARLKLSHEICGQF